jgi:hypothetical protein
MAVKRKRGKRAGGNVRLGLSGGAGPAVPPPDDPMGRNQGEQGDVGSAEAAALRAEAILRTRLMPEGNESPPGKKQR